MKKNNVKELLATCLPTTIADTEVVNDFPGHNTCYYIHTPNPKKPALIVNLCFGTKQSTGRSFRPITILGVAYTKYLLFSCTGVQVCKGLHITT